jgi:hypothetical protein
MANESEIKVLESEMDVVFVGHRKACATVEDVDFRSFRKLSRSSGVLFFV